MFDEIKRKFGLVVVDKNLLHEIWGSSYQLDDEQKNPNSKSNNRLNTVKIIHKA